jgi:hypothetical protein
LGPGRRRGGRNGGQSEDGCAEKAEKGGTHVVNLFCWERRKTQH